MLTYSYREHFIQVNGMSNKYWGWGLEDDEFYVRLKEAHLSISRPQNISTGTHNTFKLVFCWKDINYIINFSHIIVE